MIKKVKGELDLCKCVIDIIDSKPPILKSEYDTETRQLTVYCTDGSVYRLQMVQIN